ncbi:MAG TPA: SDR family NAD(P)-dependent oxidoreductase [Caulobacteraceae bacterium]
MKEFAGKAAFITGGVSGIGMGLAKVLAEAGMKVAITYRREDSLQPIKAWFAERPNLVLHPVKLDVVDREGWPRAADEVEAAIGPVELLCNNAGVGVIGPMEQATYADWDWVMGVNVGGVINGIMTFVPRMIAHGRGGHIVNVSSIGGLAALGTAGVYCTSKFAVVGLSEALHGDMAPYGVGVSVYCPGPVKSNMGEANAKRPAHLAETGYQPPEGLTEEPVKGAISFVDAWMEPEEAGRRILDGVRQGRLYILSHPELREAVRERHDAIDASWPDEPINHARAASISNLLTTQAYVDQIGRKPAV